MAIVIVGLHRSWSAARSSSRAGPRTCSSAFYEFLSDFGLGIAGPTAKPYIPLFVAFFLLILFCNWSGLSRSSAGSSCCARRPATSTSRSAWRWSASSIFQFEGSEQLGVGGYLGKFFPFYEFKNGIGAGVIALFVGLVELMLEFVKPVTLSMRLFGNIYGGEVALGVITALTIAFIPVALFGLEVMLNAIQALIFSVLTLMFIVLAIESHTTRRATSPRRPSTPSARRRSPSSSPPTDAPPTAHQPTVPMNPCRRPGE